MEHVNELFVAPMRRAVYSFKSSILFYPIVLSVASILLFLVTSRIDETLNDIGFDLPIIESLLFAGSPNAARSILATIATGWVTILSVAFSVTLIALQLSVTRHTSEIVNEFENDKTNQFTLGWFVATVVYSLLVLKTVRTGENGIDPFTPIIGVNVSVVFAVVALFIFTSYLHNITSYIKTRTLIDRVTSRTIKSLSKYEGRLVARKEEISERSSNQASIVEVSPTQEGFLRHIDWNKMSSEISKHDLYEKIRIEWLVAVGDWIGRDSIMAVVAYNINETGVGKKTEDMDSPSDADRIHHTIISSAVIGPNRSLSSDPMYGLDVLRNISMKASNQSDINSIESCVSGMFRILFHLMKDQDIIGLPFYLRKKLQKNANNDNTIAALVIPKEGRMVDEALLELSDIYDTCASNKDLSAIVRQFANQYRSYSLNLLGKGKTEEFTRLTAWYSKLVKTNHPQLRFSDTVGNRPKTDFGIEDILSRFRNELFTRHPYAVEIFDIYMAAHLHSSEA